MKIAFLLPSLANLGPIIVAKDLISCLIDEMGVDVDVFYFDSKEKTLDFPCPTKKINFFFNNFDFSSYDIVHTHGIRPDIYSHFNKTCNNLISTQHNIIFDEYIISKGFVKTKIIEYIWTYFLRKNKRVVAIGDNSYSYYSKFIKKNMLANIANGRDVFIKSIDKEDINKINTLRKKYICIGSCTRALKLKGHAQVINALCKLPNYCFILVGDGEYLEYLKKLAIKKEINERCLFLGYKSNATSYIQYFDIYSQTSYTESLSIALIEAAACAKPIIASNIPSNIQVFKDDEVVFFKLDDIDDLVEKVKYLKENAESYVNNVTSRYRKDYTVYNMTYKYFQLYQEVLNEI